MCTNKQLVQSNDIHIEYGHIQVVIVTLYLSLSLVLSLSIHLTFKAIYPRLNESFASIDSLRSVKRMVESVVAFALPKTANCNRVYDRPFIHRPLAYR